LISIESALPRLKEFVERQTPTLNAPGNALGFTNREPIFVYGVYGLANRDASQPVTLETFFQIDSSSKSFTSITLLQFQGQGLLDIGDSHSPEFIRFDEVINGKAMQAILSGGVYSRMFTL
jgi:CubicO group peptidase (beta-lactamase class C family)